MKAPTGGRHCVQALLRLKTTVLKLEGLYKVIALGQHCRTSDSSKRRLQPEKSAQCKLLSSHGARVFGPTDQKFFLGKVIRDIQDRFLLKT